MNRILIVDAEAGPRAEIEQVFVDRGDELRSASSVDDALEAVSAFLPNVILCSADVAGGAPRLFATLRQDIPADRLVLIEYARAPLSALEIGTALEAGAGAVVGPEQLAAITAVVDAQLRSAEVLGRARQSMRQLRDENLRLERDARDRIADVVREHASDPQVIANELVASHPDGVLVLAADGKVLGADVGARELLGPGLVGRAIATIVPRSRLASLASGGPATQHDRFAFDVDARSDRAPRTLQATVAVLPGSSDQASQGPGPVRVVLLVDLERRGPVEAVVRGVTSRVPDEYHRRLLETAREHVSIDALPRRATASARLAKSLLAASLHRHPVLLRGPLGSGRRRAAEVLHHASGASGPLLELACDGLGEDAQDVQLFGDTLPSGERTAGIVSRVADGTLVLLEIEHLSFAMQSKIAAIARDPHQRVIGTTTSSTEALVASGRMLPELADALARGVIDVPPLRERREDLPEMIATALGREVFPRLSPSALQALVLWEWPGGFPELDAELRRIAALTAPRIEVDDLDPEIARHASVHSGSEELRDVELSPFPAVTVEVASTPNSNGEHAPLEPQPAAASASGSSNPPRARSGAWIPEKEEWVITEDDPINMELYAKKALLRALFESNGNRTRAAEILGVGKSTLYRKMSKWGFTGEGA